MIREFESTVAPPYERGHELGRVHRAEIAANLVAYGQLFTRLGASVGSTAAESAETASAIAAAALAATDRWAPDLADEIRGIAAGAEQPLASVAALNARTEILAALGAGLRGECSTVVMLAGGQEPVAMQNWDWFSELADGWFCWRIRHPDGRVTETLTEYGIVGKIGINDRGVGVLFNILHHALDGLRGGHGIPVHVLARELLDRAGSAADALRMLRGTRTSASSAITVIDGGAHGPDAFTADIWPGGVEPIGPDPDGRILRTNHFLASRPAAGDTGVVDEPDTLSRMRALERELDAVPRPDAPTVRRALSDHGDGPLSLCTHPSDAAPAGGQYATLANVRLNFAERRLEVHAGNPCTHHDDHHDHHDVLVATSNQELQ